MELEAKITSLMQEALKAGNKPRLTALRSVKTVLMNERTRHSGPIREEDAVKVIASQKKRMINARDQYVDAGRAELAAQAEIEIKVCEELLPPPLDETELKRIIEETIESVGASSPSEMGKVMGPVMKKLAGKADGNAVREMVLKKLSQ